MSILSRFRRPTPPVALPCTDDFAEMADLYPAATHEAIGEDHLRVPLTDGGEWVSLSRLTDGRVACCVCFKFCHRHELEPVVDEPDKVWDVCRECAQSEGVAGA